MSDNSFGPGSGQVFVNPIRVPLLPQSSPPNASSSTQPQAPSATSSTRVIFIILAWMVSNTMILVTNKYLLPRFKYPICLTSLHMIVSTLLANIAISMCKVAPPAQLQSISHGVRVFILALSFSVSIVFGQMGLEHIALSYDQMVSSTGPLFTAILALIILRQFESCATYATLIPIVLGIMLSTRGEASFVFIGFFFCVLSTMMRSLKSVLQSLLLAADESYRLDSINLLRFMAPMALIVLIPGIFVMEPESPGKLWGLMRDPENGWVFCMVLAANVLLAFFVNFFNFLVTFCTSALTLQVLGSAKGVLTTWLSWTVFKSPISTIGAVGYGITLIGVFLYSECKRRFPSKYLDSRSVRFHFTTNYSLKKKSASVPENAEPASAEAAEV